MNYFEETSQQYASDTPGWLQMLDTKYHYMQQSRYLWIIDAGHGGITKEGKYATKPIQVANPPEWARAIGGTWYETKSHLFADGTRVYEGEINRAIAKQVYEQLIHKNIDFALVYDDVEDFPLSQRVTMADNIFRKDRRAIYLSIHADKMSLATEPYPTTASHHRRPATGRGIAIYTSPGQTRSDKVADIFSTVYQKHLPEFHHRTDHSDGDADLEADFYVLRKTDCPAILIENLFYDNLEEAQYLLSNSGQKAIADTIVKAITETEKLKPV